MKKVSEIATEILKTVDYPRETVEFQVTRIARKFNYELIGKKDYRLDAKDAEEVEFITSKFLHNRIKVEEKTKTATQMLPIIAKSKNKEASKTPSTKEIPLVKGHRKKKARKKNKSFTFWK